jgi:hypothetical protein
MRIFVVFAAGLVAPSLCAGAVEHLASLPLPVSPAPVVAQLHADLAALAPAASLSLPPSAVLTPAILAGLKDVPLSGAASVQTDAVRRLLVAQQILGSFDPNEFSHLPEARQEEALEKLWDGWKSRGLVGENSGRFNALVLEGVEDRALTSANKSILLGVGVLGYPLDDALWLSRTNIRDALDENKLHYPAGQRWHTDDHTPEFLGVGPHGQGLVDAWGAATAYAHAIALQVESGSKVLPENDAASHESAAAFADLVNELLRNGDHEAVAYITGGDPTFTAFLLDVRKPGYYLYNGNSAIFDRVLATRAYAALGATRLEHPDPAIRHSVTYLFRPERVVAALRAAASAPAAPGEEKVRRGLGDYAERLASLMPPSPHPRTGRYEFDDPNFLIGSVLDSPRDRIVAERDNDSDRRYDLPLPLASLRQHLRENQPYMQFSPARWRAVAMILRRCPALRDAPPDVIVRFTGEARRTRGRKIAPVHVEKGRGIGINMAALDELANLESGPPAALQNELRFFSVAIEAALAQPR